MDFAASSGSKKKKQATEKLRGDVGPMSLLRTRAPSDARLSMYSTAPAGIEVSIEEFEEFGLDRLRVLKTIEEAKSRGRTVEDMDDLVDNLWRERMRVPGSPEETRRKDTISHFVLRLGYCRTEDLRRWFLAQECTLFRHRFRIETQDNQSRLLEDHGLPYKSIGAAELKEHFEELSQVARSLNAPPPTFEAQYYKVPFEAVPDLVAGRRVLLKRGYAFVPRDQLAAIVVGHFRTVLSKALVVTNRLWLSRFQEEEGERLTPIVEGFSVRYLGEDYSNPGARGMGHVRLEDLDRLAEESFPLCMRHLFVKLREDHHLKHGGRMQLGLFLKGIGLRLEDALAFWRAEFSHRVGSEKFDKEYAYGIRHNYGKEGKRTDYTPFSCAKIIQSTPGVGDCHGCPFRHFSEDNLGALLQRVGVPPKAAAEIKAKSKQHHYQIACGMTFSATQGQPCPDTGVSHPNQYYDWSIKAKQGVNLSALPSAISSDTRSSA